MTDTENIKTEKQKWFAESAEFALNKTNSTVDGLTQAEADKRIAQARAEERRAMAVAKEQEMKAYTQEMQAKVVEAQAKVPAALADALENGRLGVMDYYRMNNINADTEMRKTIAEVSPLTEKEVDGK